MISMRNLTSFIEKTGFSRTFGVRNRKDMVEDIINENDPLVFDLLPLTLEEIFIYELGGGDSEIKVSYFSISLPSIKA